MARRTSRPVTGNDASRFHPIERSKLIGYPAKVCTWGGCNDPQFRNIPVCIRHATAIAGMFNHAPMPNVFDDPVESPDEIFVPRHYVYYLMLGPATVKIGTTRCLPKRLGALRSDLQYVVAIERGGVSVERRRHLEFSEERIPGRRREDFMLSDRLKAHIEKLMEARDEIIAEAISSPFGDMVKQVS